MVTGRLQVRSYQRNDGSQGTSIEMQVDEVGPSLRYARAKVERTSAPHSRAANASQGMGQASYNAPAGGSANDMWAQPPRGGSAFDDNPPY